MLLTPEMCRAARALLNWDESQLADAAELAIAAVSRFKAGGLVPLALVEAMLQAFHGTDLEFIPAAGGKSMGGGPGLRTAPVAEPEVAAAEAAVELDEPGLSLGNEADL
jgi:hypothetical protein